MNAREAVIEEIRNAPESLVRETYDFVLFLKNKAQRGRSLMNILPTPPGPDFLARQKEIFGDRLLPDSQTLLDELRADRS